jgi:hypothetical protein
LAAYIEFVDPQHRLDGVAPVRRFPNVVVPGFARATVAVHFGRGVGNDGNTASLHPLLQHCD